MYMAVPWLRRLVAGLSPRMPGFNPGSVHMGFVVIHYLKKRKKLIFITRLHNKPSGCGASVASAAGPFTTKKKQNVLILILWAVHIWGSYCAVVTVITSQHIRHTFKNFAAIHVHSLNKLSLSSHRALVENVQILYHYTLKRVFRLPPLFKLDLRCSRVLRSLDW
jgi:hypothetical protein